VASVVIFHSGIWGTIQAGYTKTSIELGRAGVDLFLVLSGFCLFWPLISRSHGEIAPLKPREYFRRRIRRIFPPYYAALLVTIAAQYVCYKFAGPCWWPPPNQFQSMFPLHGMKIWGDIGSHLLLLHGFWHHYAHSIDGAFWSLSLEWQFYLLFPFLVWLCRKNPAWGFAFPFAATLLFRAIVHSKDPALFRNFAINENAVSRWAEFGCGMLAAAVVRRRENAVLGALRPLSLIGRAIALPIVPAILVSLAAWLELAQQSHYLLPMAWGIAFASVAAHAGCATHGRALLTRILEWQPLVWLGTFSYSIYLVHGAVFRIMAAFISSSPVMNAHRTGIYMLAGPLIVLAVSYCFFLMFERPFMPTHPHTMRRASVVATISPAP
jgi:peptidoglycan/LPS O-acetylase OafA/YrhL